MAKDHSKYLFTTLQVLKAVPTYEYTQAETVTVLSSCYSDDLLGYKFYLTSALTGSTDT